MMILVVLPNEILSKLINKGIDPPYYFMVTNAPKNLKLHCGVLEFSAPKQQCYLPFWVYLNKMMKVLKISECDTVLIESINIEPGSLITIQPHEKAFFEQHSDPKKLLF